MSDFKDDHSVSFTSWTELGLPDSHSNTKRAPAFKESTKKLICQGHDHTDPLSLSAAYSVLNLTGSQWRQAKMQAKCSFKTSDKQKQDNNEMEQWLNWSLK